LCIHPNRQALLPIVRWNPLPTTQGAGWPRATQQKPPKLRFCIISCVPSLGVTHALFGRVHNPGYFPSISQHTTVRSISRCTSPLQRCRQVCRAVVHVQNRLVSAKELESSSLKVPSRHNSQCVSRHTHAAAVHTLVHCATMTCHGSATDPAVMCHRTTRLSQTHTHTSRPIPNSTGRGIFGTFCHTLSLCCRNRATTVWTIISSTELLHDACNVCGMDMAFHMDRPTIDKATMDNMTAGPRCSTKNNRPLEPPAERIKATQHKNHQLRGLDIPQTCSAHAPCAHRLYLPSRFAGFANRHPTHRHATLTLIPAQHAREPTAHRLAVSHEEVPHLQTMQGNALRGRLHALHPWAMSPIALRCITQCAKFAQSANTLT